MIVSLLQLAFLYLIHSKHLTGFKIKFSKVLKWNHKNIRKIRHSKLKKSYITQYLQVTHWQHPRFHAYFPAGNSFPSILADMLSDAIGCVGFSWVKCDNLIKKTSMHIFFVSSGCESSLYWIGNDHVGLARQNDWVTKGIPPFYGAWQRRWCDTSRLRPSVASHLPPCAQWSCLLAVAKCDRIQKLHVRQFTLQCFYLLDYVIL